MKQLYKSTKVEYNAHLHQYEVYYRNWLFWRFDSCYKYDDNPRHIIHYCNQEQAKERAIARASAMLNTVEVWRQSNWSTK